IILNRHQDGVEQITTALQHHKTIKTLDIVAHGSPGCLSLGNTQLKHSTLDDYAHQLKTWSQSLTPDAQILIYGCHVAHLSQGLSFVEELSQLTQAKIAASAHLTGAQELGGDWELEVKTGEIDTGLALAAEVRRAYDHVLATNSLDDDWAQQTQNLLIQPEGIIATQNSSLNLADLNGSNGF
ncbi:MAG: DUF4347 domain-containing protein, partial [Alphaproteobacteria bacterium]